jgi:hypothetical protein
MGAQDMPAPPDEPPGFVPDDDAPIPSSGRRKVAEICVFLAIIGLR